MMRDITNYVYEMGQLKRVRRSGWWVAGIDQPESVADHSFRTAILGYILASLEGVDPNKTAILCLFHDTQETRINDLHKLAQRYIDLNESENLVLTEQVERLPENIADAVLSLMRDYDDRESPEACIAHDADRLECLFQAREYQVQGYSDVQDWINTCYADLKTESAKKIADESLEVAPSEWWQSLKPRKIERNS